MPLSPIILVVCGTSFGCILTLELAVAVTGTDTDEEGAEKRDRMSCLTSLMAGEGDDGTFWGAEAWKSSEKSSSFVVVDACGWDSS